MGALIEKDDLGNWAVKGIKWEDLREGKVITREIADKLYGCLCKLKDYEESGLEPEEVESIRHPYYEGFKEGKKVGYNKAIDDFLEKIQWEYLNGSGIKQSEIEFLVAVSSQVAEQLKDGGENETN